jgi:hypothetical protein
MRSVDNHIEQEISDSSSEEEDITEIAKSNIPLFANSAIYKSKNNLLYAGAKIGKSYFAIEVAKHESIKKPLFIVLEDYSNDQTSRYEINLPKKDYELIKLGDFDEILKKEKESRKSQAYLETIKDVSLSGYHRIRVFRKQNYIDMGLVDKNGKLDKIAVIEKIIEDAINHGNDFICIDPLFAMVEGSGRAFNREHIIRIIRPISEKHITLLLLHHETKSKKMALTQELKNTFDNIYKLEITKRSEEADELSLIEEGARDNIPHILTIKRTFAKDKTVKYELINTEIFQSDGQKAKKSIKSYIRDIISYYNDEILPFDELIKELKAKTEKSSLDVSNIEKRLKELRDEEKVVEMTDGEMWKNGIKILKENI